MINEESLIELDVICMSCQGEYYEDRDCGHRDRCYVTNCKEALLSVMKFTNMTL